MLNSRRSALRRAIVSSTIYSILRVLLANLRQVEEDRREVEREVDVLASVLPVALLQYMRTIITAWQLKSSTALRQEPMKHRE